MKRPDVFPGLAFFFKLALYCDMSNSEKDDQFIRKAIAVKGAAPAEGDAATLPKITAKGSGAFAEKLLDIAFSEGVKVRQDKDLTELLDAFDVESPIPLEALQAVSVILERVYEENRELAGEGQTKDVVAPAAGGDAAGSTLLDGNTREPLGETPTYGLQDPKGPA